LGKGRLEAFSDGVIAVIITIMVLEMKAPHDASPAALEPFVPIFLSYVLSFVFVGLYWSNHHHMLHTVKEVTGGTLWANLHLLFWLSLVPFATAWMGQNHGASLPTATYGFVLLAAAVAYSILQGRILAHHGKASVLARAVGKDIKGKLSIAAYVAAIPVALYDHPFVAQGVYVAVALAWLVPDRRIEQKLAR
jgi:uncharacterized membrane protein